MSLSRNAHEVLGRALVDSAFRASLFTDPRSACDTVGLALTEAEYAAIGNFDRDTFEGAARDLAGAGAVG